MSLKNNINLFAIGLHSFGGLSILKSLLTRKYNNIFLDYRLKKKKLEIISDEIDYLNSYSLKRLILEKKISNQKGVVIYGNGLPPFFKSKSYVYCIFQNANIFRDFYEIKYLKWFFSLDSLRYFYFQIFKKNVDCWIVFSPLSEKIIKSKVPSYIPVKIYNIFNTIKFSSGKSENKIYDFIYPASALSHKNHKLILEALINLSKKNIFPKIFLTLKESEKQKLNINALVKAYNLKIHCEYLEDQSKFQDNYKKSKTLLYVSKNETLALPILEAYNYGLIIIAPKTYYSSQFIKPDFTYMQSDVNSLTSSMIEALDQKHSTKKKFPKLENFSDFLREI